MIRGSTFPWDVFMRIINEEADGDMDAKQAGQLEDAHNIVYALATGQDVAKVHDKDGILHLGPFYRRVALEVAALNDLDPDELEAVQDGGP